jgi:hypothetical protein
MVQIALVLIALGFIALVVGFMERLKAGRVSDAPLVKTGDAAARGAAVANAKGGLSAEGNVLCREPLVSPVTGVPCLYYSLKVTASWKDGDHEKSRELTKEKRAAQFAIDDGSGPVPVDARDGGDFEPSQKKEETQSTSLLGGLTGKDLVFGNYRISTGLLSLGTKYEVVEEVLPVVPRLYACGKTGAGGAIAAPGWRSLILSAKSRDELLAGAAKNAKMFLGGGAGAFAVGVALAVVASLTAPPATAAVPVTTSAPAAAPAETTAPAATAATAAPTATSTPAPVSKPAARLPASKSKPKR